MPQRGTFGGNGFRSTRVGESANSTATRPTSGLENANPTGPVLTTKASGAYAPSSAAVARPRGSFGADITKWDLAKANTTGIVGKTEKSKPRTLQAPPHNPEPPVAPAVADMLRPAQEERRFDHTHPMHPCCPRFADEVTVKSEQKRNASAAVKVYNVQEVEEYAQDIEEHLLRDELVYLPRADYMDMQADLTPKMRMILMDWLIEVHMKYRLRCETLHLTVNLIDRHLTRIPVARKRLQLVGVCAMFIAAKFEEITPPELHDWVYITDKAYTKEEVLGMEVTMLSALNFQIVVPTAAHFFHIFEKANGCNDMHRSLAQYILELGILDIRMLEFAPSNVIAAALLLSNDVLGRRSPWPPVMVEQSRHTESSLRGCVELMRQLFDADRLGAGGQLGAVHKKFSMVERHVVATMMF